MALSEVKRAEIISFSGKMSADEIANKVGVGRATVFRVLRESKAAKTEVRTVSKSKDLPARTRTHDKGESIKTVSKVSKIDTENDTVLSPSLIAKVALTHLISEIDLYNEALAEKQSEDEKIRSMAEWKAVNHEKLVQSALRIVAQWFGMDKGDVLKAIEELRHDPFATMSKEELLALYEVTR